MPAWPIKSYRNGEQTITTGVSPAQEVCMVIFFILLIPWPDLHDYMMKVPCLADMTKSRKSCSRGTFRVPAAMKKSASYGRNGDQQNEHRKNDLLTRNECIDLPNDNTSNSKEHR